MVCGVGSPSHPDVVHDRVTTDLRDQEVEEARELLRRLAADHLTFLGYREYQLTDSADARAEAREHKLLVLTKANSRATGGPTAGSPPLLTPAEGTGTYGAWGFATPDARPVVPAGRPVVLSQPEAERGSGARR
ncbi:hypothetical protein [Streptomyces sp. NPDC102264]|uniref:hypothetical protein n=1 Tax=Streptomyces sp. NPDC102264 TaxID=3366149 RepID=UPI0038080E8F